MAKGFYRAVTDELKAMGYAWRENAKGSHEKWGAEASGRVVIVPRNLKSRHTANAILRDAGSEKRL